MRVGLLAASLVLAACGGESAPGPETASSGSGALGVAEDSLRRYLHQWLGIDAAVQSPVSDASGRFLAFLTHAPLDPEDTDTTADVYWFDRETGRTVLVSRGLQGGSAEGPCLDPAMAPEGDSVAFVSFAANLTPALGSELGVDGMADVFVAQIDVEGGQVRSLTQASIPDPELLGETANGHSFGPSLASQGQRVAFWSFADNLAPGDRNGDVADIFAVDLGPQAVRRRLLVSAHPTLAEEAGPSGGASQWPSLSADGRTLAFTSKAWNLVEQDANDILPDVFVARLAGIDEGELEAQRLERIAPETGPIQEALPPGANAAWSSTGRAHLAGDGSRVAFEVRLSSGRASVELAQLGEGSPQVLHVAADCAQAVGEARQPQLSGDGLYLTVLSPRDVRGGHFGLPLPAGLSATFDWTAAIPLSPPRSRDGVLAGGRGFFAFTATGPQGRSQRLAGRVLERP